MARATRSTGEAMSEKDSGGSVIGMFTKNFGTILLVVAALLIGYLWSQVQLLKQGGGSLAGTTPTGAGAQPVGTPRPELTDGEWNELLNGAAGSIGDADAPLVMVEFTDYECPFCERHYSQTHATLVEEYVNTGKLRILIRDLPLPFHPSAEPAAQAARCAGDQARYMPMHDELFSRQSEWVSLSGEAQTAKFVELASAIGANTSTFRSCLDTEKFAQAVQDDLTLASKVGANGTPTFFLNKQLLEADGLPGQSAGAAPIEFFKRKFDEQL